MMMRNGMPPQGQMPPPQRPPQGLPSQMQMPQGGPQGAIPPQGQGGMDEARRRQMLAQLLMGQQQPQQNAIGGVDQALRNGIQMYMAQQGQ